MGSGNSKDAQSASKVVAVVGRAVVSKAGASSSKELDGQDSAEQLEKESENAFQRGQVAMRLVKSSLSGDVGSDFDLLDESEQLLESICDGFLGK